MPELAEPNVSDAATGRGDDRVAALIAGRAPEAVRLRAVLGLVVSGGRHEIPHLVRGCGLSRQLVVGLLRSAGADIGWDGDTVWFAGVQREYQELIAAKSMPSRHPGSSSHLGDPVPATLVERMRDILARVPPPIRGLDHVAATAETVLRRARYLAREFDLDQTCLLFVGDHDCTSLAFAVLGVAPRSVTVVDIDERLLAFLASQPQAADGSITPLFADLRLGLPDSVRAAHDVALADPPYTADGVGLFVARAVEGLAEPAKGRILLAYGYSESTPALGLKVQRALTDLELLFEAVLPDFNHYDGAQAIGSRSDLYRLRPTKRTDRIAVRALARYAKTLYTHGSQSEESRDTSARVTAENTVAQSLLEQFGGTAPLLVGAGWAGHTTVPLDRFLSAEKPSRQTETTIIDLRPLFGWSLIRAALTATSERTIIIAPRDAYGLHSAAESASLRTALEPSYQVENIQRSFHGTDSAVIELRRTTRESVAANVWRRPHSRVATTWRESLIAAARRHGTELTKNQARTLIEQAQLTASVTDHNLIDLPFATLARLREAIDETARPYSADPADCRTSEVMS